MKMVMVRGVVVRPQHTLEMLAGRIAQRTQEARLVSLAPPVPGQTDAAPIRQAEGTDIQGVGSGMPAPAPAATDPPAGEAAEMLDARHRLTEEFLRQRLHAVPLEQRV